MDWADVLPVNVALRQEAWERRLAMRRMSGLGLSVRRIAAYYKISGARVYQLLDEWRGRSPPSPVQRYWDEAEGYVAEMARRMWVQSRYKARYRS